MTATVLDGVLASLAAGCATGVGALPAFFFRSVPDRVMNTMLGAAAGVMLAATSFSLIVPGIDAGAELWGMRWAVAAVVGGMLAGAVFLDLADRYLPQEHLVLYDGGLDRHEGPASKLRKIWLFIIAVTIHNLPEGLAVGVGYGAVGSEAAPAERVAELLHNARALAIGIGLQNMPEGLAVALPLVGLGYSRGAAVLIALATGLVEPLGALLGAGAVTYFRPMLPIGLGFAAGAMLFVISDEIIPETHSHGKSRLATFGVLIGFVIMMSMDNLLG
ncbi:MAG: ZIP family metal transporter [Planctomycetota bacterium]